MGVGMCWALARTPMSPVRPRARVFPSLFLTLSLSLFLSTCESDSVCVCLSVCVCVGLRIRLARLYTPTTKQMVDSQSTAGSNNNNNNSHSNNNHRKKALVRQKLFCKWRRRHRCCCCCCCCCCCLCWWCAFLHFPLNGNGNGKSGKGGEDRRWKGILVYQFTRTQNTERTVGQQIKPLFTDCSHCNYISMSTFLIISFIMKITKL